MGQAYLGALGRTRMATVHVSDAHGALVALQVYVGIDAAADPALAAQLRGDALNVMWLDGRELRIAVPVVYHDAAARLLVLVLGDAHRHRELEERIRVLEQLRDDRADVPAYAKDFAVVFGATGLRALLDQRAGRARSGSRSRPGIPFEDAAIGAADATDAVDDALDGDAAERDGGAGAVEAPVIADEPPVDDGPLSEFERAGAYAAVHELDADGGLVPIDDGDDLPGDETGLAPELEFDADAPVPEFDADAPVPEFDADAAAAEFDAETGPGLRNTGGESRRVTDLALDAAAVVEIAAALDAEAVADDADADALSDDDDLLRPPDTLPEADEIADEISIELIRHRPGTVEPTDPTAPGTDPLTTETIELPVGPSIAPAIDPAASVAPRDPMPRAAGDAPTTVDPEEALAAGDEPASAEPAEPPTAGDEPASAEPAEPRDTATAMPAVAGDAATSEPRGPGDTEPAVPRVDGEAGAPPAPRAPDAAEVAAPAPAATAAALPAGWHLDGGAVELVIAVDEALAAALTGALDVRLVLHRTPMAPVIALVIGAPAALRAPLPGPFTAATLDVAADADRAVLRALGRSFELTVTLSRDGRAIRRCRLTAPLADNVGYLVQAADEHLHDLSERGEPDSAAARDRVLAGDFDLLGAGHPERGELRADKLAQIATARQLRRALAIARHFTWPAAEDYLVCIRGFPLSRWHQLRRAAVARAVAWGLWMGPELAQIAVSEGFARSRRDLIARLDRGFEQLRHDARAFDIDAEATADNAAAIADQARALGVPIRAGSPNGTGAIASDAAQVASGSIDLTPLPESTPRTTDELLVLLDDATAGRGGRTRRLAAALALCDLADPRAAGPVVAAALKMSRGEAVRVLAGAVKFGDAAQPALVAGLASSKTYLRHGCALALALLRSDEATQAVIALLHGEPTELWHELARAIGQIGTPALVWLVRDIGAPRPGSDERIAWAMAHVAANGGAPAVSTMAAADSIVAPIARKALELSALTGGDQGAEPDAAGSASERDLSVNHAFSRQFFEALDHRASAAAAAAASTAHGAPAAAES